MKSYAFACAFLLLAAATGANAAPQELGLTVGRATDSRDTDIVRLTYRRPLFGDSAAAPWWRPQYLQFGASVWRVPDLGGITRRYDASVTPVWRRETAIGYVEAGIGAYLLSHTINNDNNRLPSALQFGSHIGAGLRLGEARRSSVGLALQHLSNAGIKQPNGGINFYLLTIGVEL
jgi:lipid A 3-O-deacylase